MKNISWSEKVGREGKTFFIQLSQFSDVPYDGRHFHESSPLKFFSSSVKQRPKRPGILVHPPGQLRHDVTAAYHGGMSGQGIAS
jgi:hypothetical protein